MTTITIELPEDLYLLLQKYAAEDGVSIEVWCIEALRKYLTLRNGEYTGNT